jgi:hypothetical protein
MLIFAFLARLFIAIESMEEYRRVTLQATGGLAEPIEERLTDEAPKARRSATLANSDMRQWTMISWVGTEDNQTVFACAGDFFFFQS